jgi:hypothetical protein
MLSVQRMRYWQWADDARYYCSLRLSASWSSRRLATPILSILALRGRTRLRRTQTMSFLQARYLDNHSLRILDERPRCIHFLLKTKPRLSTTSFDAFCSRTRERSQKRSGPDEPVTLENSRTRRKQCYDRSSTIKPVANRQERNEIKDFLSPAFVDRLQKRPSLYANFFPRLLNKYQ